MKKYLLLFLILTVTSLGCYAMSVQLGTINPTCSYSNGTVYIAYLNGGSPPFTYAWTGGVTTDSLTNVGPGTYSLLVTDSNGDTASASVTLTTDNMLAFTTMTYITPGGASVNYPCNSQCNGIQFAHYNDLRGIPPYTLSVTNSSNPNITTATVGGYSAVINVCSDDVFDVYAIDAGGCTGSVASLGVFPPYSWDLTTTVSPACNAGSNGKITVDFLNNGTPIQANYTGPVSGSVNGGPGQVTINNLLPGMYTIDLIQSISNSCDTVILVNVPDAGSNCGVITGKVYIDSTSNCVADASEETLSSQIVQITPGPYYATSDSAGNYAASLPYGTYSVSHIASTPGLVPVCTTSPVILSAVNDTVIVDLADSVINTFDLKSSFSASAFRPGFTAVVYLNIRNNSYGTFINPQLEFNYDTLLTYISSSIAPSMTTQGQLIYTFDSLFAFQQKIITVSFSLPPDPLLIGDTLSFSSNAISGVAETDSVNNHFSSDFIITGAVDPNDKSVLPADGAPFFVENDSIFRYTIRFQNTGNDTAFNVVIVDSLSDLLDASTFSLIASSHPVQWQLSGHNVLTFNFSNILLPDSNTNEPLSHGAVSFAVKPINPAPVGSVVYNTADIYFDFNPAVTTNTVSNTFMIEVGLNEINGNNVITIHPNPATIGFYVRTPAAYSNPLAVSVYSITGGLLKEILTDDHAVYIPAEHFDSGIYMIVVTDNQGHTARSKVVLQKY